MTIDEAENTDLAGRYVAHIGFSKVMSSWLQVLFENHPDICMVKKSGLLARKMRGEDISPTSYGKIFDGNNTTQTLIESDEHLLLPAMHPDFAVRITNQSLQVLLLQTIKAVIPDARILICIRRQRDLVVSRYIQYIRRHCGTLTPKQFFGEFVADDRWIDYVDYRFARLAKFALSLFGDDRVFVFVLEQFAANPASVLGRLESFLGVRSLSDYQPVGAVNASPPYLSLVIERYINGFFCSDALIRENNGFRTALRSAALYGGIATEVITSKMHLSRDKGRLMPADYLEYIDDLFAEDNIELQSLLPFDEEVRKYPGAKGGE